MAVDPDLPDPDRLPGAPHPRETLHLYGQSAAEAAFLAAFGSGNVHHAWLLTGPEGVGKATLAWRIARFLLATPPQDAGPSFFAETPVPPATLDIEADHPVARRIAALSEPRLFLVRRGPNTTGKALSADIRVDEIRKLAGFLRLSAADGGQRVVIIDAADDMNVAAANALLKFLEEPPPRVTFLLVSHRPSSLLPTIRSRCRTLRLDRLSPADLDLAVAQSGADPAGPGLATLSDGSPGRAVRLSLADGLATYAAALDVLATLPNLDRARAIAFAQKSARRGADASAELTFELLSTLLARLARRGASGTDLPEVVPGEARTLARLSPDPAAARAWADADAEAQGRIRHGLVVNLDPAALLLDTVLRISETAGRVAAG
jgi:DNA polymerase-3 subunit delta'